MEILHSLFTIVKYLLPPLLLTIAVECTLVFAIYRNTRYMYYVLLLNILTNPLLNFIMLIYFSYVGMSGYYLLLYSLEVAVVISEGLIFSKLSDKKIWEALLVSLALNIGSYLSGLLTF